MANSNITNISLCIQMLTDFLEDNCDPEERAEEVYPDIFGARQILMVSQEENSTTPVTTQTVDVERSHSIPDLPTLDFLFEYGGFEDITQKALAEEITLDQKFDQLLDEFEFKFTDDIIDRKRLLAALRRKADSLDAFIEQE